jgi:hypothetical protein
MGGDFNAPERFGQKEKKLLQLHSPAAYGIFRLIGAGTKVAKELTGMVNEFQNLRQNVIKKPGWLMSTAFSWLTARLGAVLKAAHLPPDPAGQN